jgi:hypothetical protein
MKLIVTIESPRALAARQRYRLRIWGPMQLDHET